MKKAIVFIPFLVVSIIILNGCTFQHGTSKDYVYGYDTGILWNHLYLKDDHSTCYCFDDPEFIETIEEAQAADRKVLVTYEKYVFRGGLCWSADGYENVVVTKVGIVANEYN